MAACAEQRECVGREAGLVDEYQFVLIPIALGAGRTVFAKRCGLRLVEQRAFRCGNVVVTYAAA